METKRKVTVSRELLARGGMTGRRWAAILSDEEAAVLVKATLVLVADTGFTAGEQLDLRRATAALNAARIVR